MAHECTPTESALIQACGCPIDRDYDCYQCDLGGWAGTPHDCPRRRLCNHPQIRRLLARGELIVMRDGSVVPPASDRPLAN